MLCSIHCKCAKYPICLVLVISIIIRQRLWLASAHLVSCTLPLSLSPLSLSLMCLLAILQYDIYSYFLLILYSICALLIVRCFGSIVGQDLLATEFDLLLHTILISSVLLSLFLFLYLSLLLSHVLLLLSYCTFNLESL